MQDHIKKLYSALSLFDQLSPKNMPTHHAQTYLLIGSHSSVTYRDIEKSMGISNASASRIVHALADIKATHRKTNLNLVEIYIDPEESRRYRVRLTSKGKELMKALDFMKGTTS